MYCVYTHVFIHACAGARPESQSTSLASTGMAWAGIEVFSIRAFFFKLKADKRFCVERFEPIASQSAVSSPLPAWPGPRY